MGSEWFLARMEPEIGAVSGGFTIALRVRVPLGSHSLLAPPPWWHPFWRVRARLLRMAASLTLCGVERLVPKLLCGDGDDAGGQLPGQAVPRAPVG